MANSYGDGQAVFKGLINFTKGYYIWDGITGTGSNYSAYGFKILPSSCVAEQYLMGIPAIGYSSYQVDHINVSHTAMITCGKGDGGYTQVGIYSLVRDGYASSNINISNNYFSNASSNMLIRQAQLDDQGG